MFCSLPLVQQQIPCSFILFNNNVPVLSSYFTIMYVFSSLHHIMQQFSCSVLLFYTFSILYLRLCNNAHFISTTMFMICSRMFQFHQERGCSFLGSSQGDGRAREGEMAGEAEEDVHEEVWTEARTFAVFQDTRRGQQRPGKWL